MTHTESVRGFRAAGMFAVLAALTSSGLSHASVRTWDYTPGLTSGTSIDNTGGTFRSVRSEYDPATRTLAWSVDFSDRVTQGFSLVLSGGQTPIGRTGEYAIIYFDAAAAVTGLSSVPRLTAYTYNGRGTPDSWSTVDGLGTPGECIKSLWDSDWIFHASAGDVLLDGGIEGRRFSFTIDATDLINHRPALPGGVFAPWFGTGYGDQLGLWMFTAGVFEAAYGPTGRMIELGTELRGNLMGGNLPTGGIPTPGAAALFAGGLLAAGRRRRR